jgi:predicted RNA methylase
MELPYETEQVIAENAATDSGFAIAAALLRLADAQEKIARRLSDLGTGNAATQMGAIEFLTVELKSALQEVAGSIAQVAETKDAIERVASSIRQVAETIEEQTVPL